MSEAPPETTGPQSKREDPSFPIKAPKRGECQIRVRYAETDRMGLLHHANYLIYFEQARTELLRDVGYSYRDL